MMTNPTHIKAIPIVITLYLIHFSPNKQRIGQKRQYSPIAANIRKEYLSIKCVDRAPDIIVILASRILITKTNRAPFN